MPPVLQQQLREPSLEPVPSFNAGDEGDDDDDDDGAPPPLPFESFPSPVHSPPLKLIHISPPIKTPFTTPIIHTSPSPLLSHTSPILTSSSPSNSYIPTPTFPPPIPSPTLIEEETPLAELPIRDNEATHTPIPESSLLQETSPISQPSRLTYSQKRKLDQRIEPTPFIDELSNDRQDFPPVIPLYVAPTAPRRLNFDLNEPAVDRSEELPVPTDEDHSILDTLHQEVEQMVRVEALTVEQEPAPPEEPPMVPPPASTPPPTPKRCLTKTTLCKLV